MTPLSLVPVPHSDLEDASCPVLLRLQASLACLGISMVLHVHLPLPKSVNTAASAARRETLPWHVVGTQHAGPQDRVDARSPPKVWTSGACPCPTVGCNGTCGGVAPAVMRRRSFAVEAARAHLRCDGGLPSSSCPGSSCSSTLAAPSRSALGPFPPQGIVASCGGTRAQRGCW